MSVLTLFPHKSVLKVAISQTFIYFEYWQSFRCVTNLMHENVSHEVECHFTHLLVIHISSSMISLFISPVHFCAILSDIFLLIYKRKFPNHKLG